MTLATIAGALATWPGRVDAAGAWIASNATFAPIEQRVAIAANPGRTTVWTSLRFAAGGGKLGIIVPAPVGASLDISSDAWFEALEVATAPRLFPPASADPFCPGKSGSPDIFQLDGQVAHVASPAPQDVAVLDDADKVVTWAAQAGLSVPPAVLDAIGGAGNMRFVGLRFDLPSGAGVTPTLRVVMPGATARLPLALTPAGAEDLRVTAWTFGPSRADLIGATEVSVAPSVIEWNAKAGASDYDDRRTTALASDPTRFLVEAASHTAIADTLSIANGNATIDSVVSTFFERAAAYGDGNFDATACLKITEPALTSSLPVGTSCPQASLGTIAPAPACTESTAPNETSPATLRCGPGADDLAIALSGLTPQSAWISRQILVIPASGLGLDWPISFSAGALESALITCGSVSYDDCYTDGGVPDGGSPVSSSSSSSSSHASSGGTVIHDYGSDPVVVGETTISWWDAIDTGLDSACSCTGPDAYASSGDYSSSGDTCSSDTSSSDGSGCSGGDGVDTESCSGDSGDTESCSGDGVDSESCSSGGAGDSCSGGGGDSCSGGDLSGCDGDVFKCTTARSHRPRGPRFSILLVCALTVLVPLRRRGRKTRKAAGRLDLKTR
ncbi:Hypothetical protein A7982_08821 [Minicystis rosea]|nr:Hypothetical protein A7982_08821 [Minicystis rosea]